MLMARLSSGGMKRHSIDARICLALDRGNRDAGPEPVRHQCRDQSGRLCPDRCSGPVRQRPDTSREIPSTQRKASRGYVLSIAAVPPPVNTTSTARLIVRLTLPGVTQDIHRHAELRQPDRCAAERRHGVHPQCDRYPHRPPPGCRAERCAGGSCRLALACAAWSSAAPTLGVQHHASAQYHQHHGRCRHRHAGHHRQCHHHWPSHGGDG